jgi:hypothetical protein
MTKDDMEAVNKTIAIAKEKRDRLLIEINQLDSFISQAELLFGTQEHDLPPVTIKRLNRRAPLQDKPVDKMSIADKVHKILMEHNAPMSSSEIVQEFRKRGWGLDTKNAGEILRFTLRKKTDVFLKDSSYRYYFKGMDPNRDNNQADLFHEKTMEPSS